MASPPCTTTPTGGRTSSESSCNASSQYLRAEVDLDFDSAKLSIEHVLPQTLSDGWKKQLVDAGHDPREVFERLGHTLGNLTLTAWNSKLSNQMFERKQEILQDSELKLNEHPRKASQWGVEEIQKRSEVLADAANACGPRRSRVS